MNLLASNAKLDKEQSDYLIRGLTLAPHGISGHQVCPESTVGCRASCNLWFAGQRRMLVARSAAIRNTRWLFRDRATFVSQLRRDLFALVVKAHKLGRKPLCRLNVASDLDWCDLIAGFPEVTFYDYTVVRSRFNAFLNGELPGNYHLTYSQKEKADESLIASYLLRGGNVAQVFDILYNPQHKKYGLLPSHAIVAGDAFRVVDGDIHDLRLPAYDGSGVVVGLRLKGTNAAKSRARANGFAT